MAVTRIQNNQIYDSTINAAVKVAPGSLTGNLFAPTVTINSNVTVTGNLTVSGSYETVSATNTYINDPLVTFNNGYSGSLSGYDIGILVNRNLASLGPYGSVNAAWVWVENDQAFEAFTTTDTGTGSASINNSGFANIKLGNLTVTNAGTFGTTLGVTGAVTHSSTTNLIGQTTYSTAVGGGIQALAIGNVTPGTGAFTTITTGGLQAVAIGNATPGTGNFTTITATTLNAATIGNAGAVMTGASSTLTGTLIATTVNAATIGNAAASIVGQNFTASGTIIASTVNAATIGNIGAVFTGASETLSGTLIAATVNAATIGNAGAVVTAATINSTYSNPTNIATANALITGGYIQSTPIGNATPSSGAFTTLTASSSFGVTGPFTFTTATGGGLQAVAIGNVTPGTAAFTTATTGGLQAVAIGNATPGTGAFTTLTSSGATTVTAATQATSSSTGALVVTGGVGIGANLYVGGNATIIGNFTVIGTTTSVQSQTLDVTDLNITVAKGASTAAAANGAGLTVDGASATLLYTSATDTWNLNKGLVGTTGTFSSTLGVTGATTLTTATVGGLQAVAIGNVTPGTGAFTSVTANTETVGGLQAVAIGNVTPGTGAFTTLTNSGVHISNGNIVAASGTGSTNTTTGALIVTGTGGVGIGGNINAGVFNTSVHNIQGNVLFGQGPVAGSADSIITINLNTSAPLTATNSTVHMSGADSKNATYGADSFGTGTYSSVYLRHARGSSASPSAVQSNDWIGGVFAKGYGATGYISAATYPAPGMVVLAAENFTDSAHGTYLQLKTTPVGTLNAVVGLTLHNNGNVYIPSSASAAQMSVSASNALTVNGGAQIAGNVFLGTNAGNYVTSTGNLVLNSGNTATSGSSTTGALMITGTGGAYIGGNVVSTGVGYFGPTQNTIGLGSPIIVGTGNTNNYIQVQIQNTSSGSQASSDFVATADNGSDSANYIDMGINSSGWSLGTWTMSGARDGYVFVNGGNMTIGTDTSSKTVSIHTGGTLATNIVTTFNAANTQPTNQYTGSQVVWGGQAVTGNLFVGNAAVFNNAQLGGRDVVIKGKTDSTLFWARPDTASYDQVLIGGSGTISTLQGGAKLVINSTDSMLLPTGTTAQRPSNAGYTDVTGMFRYNSTLGYIEFYTGTAWQGVTSQFTLITDTQVNGTGSQTNFTVANLSATSATIVSINGVLQIPSLAYSCFTSNNALIFTEAPASTDVIDVRCLTTTQTVTGISSTNGYMSFSADNNGAYVSTGTSVPLVTTFFDTTGSQVSNIANVTVASANTVTTIDTMNNSAYRSAKYIVQVTNGANYQVSEALVISNGTTATITTYATLQTNGNLGILQATQSGSNTLVQFIAANATNSVRIKKDYLMI
jgi:hypothetical protein